MGGHKSRLTADVLGKHKSNHNHDHSKDTPRCNDIDNNTTAMNVVVG